MKLDLINSRLAEPQSVRVFDSVEDAEIKDTILPKNTPVRISSYKTIAKKSNFLDTAPTRFDSAIISYNGDIVDVSLRASRVKRMMDFPHLTKSLPNLLPVHHNSNSIGSKYMKEHNLSDTPTPPSSSSSQPKQKQPSHPANPKNLSIFDFSALLQQAIQEKPTTTTTTTSESFLTGLDTAATGVALTKEEAFYAPSLDRVKDHIHEYDNTSIAYRLKSGLVPAVHFGRSSAAIKPEANQPITASLTHLGPGCYPVSYTASEPTLLPTSGIFQGTHKTVTDKSALVGFGEQIILPVRERMRLERRDQAQTEKQEHFDASHYQMILQQRIALQEMRRKKLARKKAWKERIEAMELAGEDISQLKFKEDEEETEKDNDGGKGDGEKGRRGRDSDSNLVDTSRKLSSVNNNKTEKGRGRTGQKSSSSPSPSPPPGQGQSRRDQQGSVGSNDDDNSSLGEESKTHPHHLMLRSAFDGAAHQAIFGSSTARFTGTTYRQESYLKTTGLILSHDYDASWDKRIPIDFKAYSPSPERREYSKKNSGKDGKEDGRKKHRKNKKSSFFNTMTQVDGGKIYSIAYEAEHSPIKYRNAFAVKEKEDGNHEMPLFDPTGSKLGPGVFYPEAYPPAISIHDPKHPSRTFLLPRSRSKNREIILQEEAAKKAREEAQVKEATEKWQKELIERQKHYQNLAHHRSKLRK